jgi:hypothetical protein
MLVAPYVLAAILFIYSDVALIWAEHSESFATLNYAVASGILFAITGAVHAVLHFRGRL